MRQCTQQAVGGHEHGAGAGAACRARDTGSLEGFGQGHRRQDGDEAAGQPRCARARGAQQEAVMRITPASASFLFPHPGVGAAKGAGMTSSPWLAARVRSRGRGKRR
jgi:hypothetical protein